jgi:hypothetical protein
MRKTQSFLVLLALFLTAFFAGRWSSSSIPVHADSRGGAPQIQVQTVRGDSSLTVFYPDQNKLYIYQSPFVGLPNWSCSYSVQLSTPGGQIQRLPCNDPSQNQP